MHAELSDFVHVFRPSESGDPVTLLMLHGTGGNEESLLPFAQSLRQSAAVLSPRGAVLENGLPRFFKRFAEGVFDEEDMKLQTAKLHRFIDSAAAAYGFDRNKVVAVGYSNGANIAASLILRNAQSLHGAVLFRATLPFEPANPPEGEGVRVLICAGEEDPFAPRAKVERLTEVLEAGGVEVKVRWQHGGHELTSPEIEEAANWLKPL